jgi:hypothetical protein
VWSANELEVSMHFTDFRPTRRVASWPVGAASLLLVATIAAACGAGIRPGTDARGAGASGSAAASLPSQPAASSRATDSPGSAIDSTVAPGAPAATDASISGQTPADPAGQGSSASQAMPTEDPAIQSLLDQVDGDLSNLDGALNDDAANTTQNGSTGALP